MERFPPDFYFQLSEPEFENWRSQFATYKSDKMSLRRRPFAFTEPGVSMISAILKSGVAIEISVKIIRAFVQMRHFLEENASVLQKFQQIDQNSYNTTHN